MAPIFIFIVLAFSFNSEAMECKTGLKGEARSQQIDSLVVEFKSLRSLVSKSSIEDHEKIAKLVKITGCISIIDPSGYAGELIAPLMEKNQSETMQEVEKLPKAQSQKLLNQIKVFQKVKKSGNG